MTKEITGITVTLTEKKDSTKAKDTTKVKKQKKTKKEGDKKKEKKICAGIKEDGTPCSNKVMKGNKKFCGVHDSK